MKEEDIIDNQWYKFEFDEGGWWAIIGSEYKKFLQLAKELEEIEYKLMFGDNYER